MSELMSSLQAIEEMVKLEPDDKPSSSKTRPKGISLEKMKQRFEIGEPNLIIGKKARKGKGKTNAQPKEKCLWRGWALEKELCEVLGCQKARYDLITSNCSCRTNTSNT